jgi:hypothetical protein
MAVHVGHDLAAPGRFGVELRWVDDDADAPVSFPYQGADVG